MRKTGAGSNKRLTRLMWILMPFELIIFTVFAALDRKTMGLGVGFCFALVIYLAWASWKDRIYTWYWTGLLIAFLCQIPFVLFVPWENYAGRGIVLMPFCLVDLLVTYGCMTLVKKFFHTDEQEFPQS